MLVVLPILLSVGIYRWNDRFDAVTIAKVNDDLTIARQYLSRILENTETKLVAIGESERFRQLLRAGGDADKSFPVYLRAAAQRGAFDFLYVVADDGAILAREKAASSARLRWDWPVVVSALAGQPKTAIDVFESSELSALSPQLAERARVEIVSAMRDGASGDLFETRGLVLQSAAALLLAILATVPLFLFWARTIFRPLERMKETIARVEDGDLAARTGTVENRDEIGLVATELDRLLNAIQARDAELRLWNEQLSQRAEQRTLELHDASARLETTTRQLVMSEKLASIGEITAGVAHEINNPIAVMQGNLELIRDMMGPGAEEAKTEFRLINQQMHRITEIVTKLLQFAKPQEYVGFIEDYAPADVIADTLPLVQHLLKKTMITVAREDRALRLIRMNRTELQQVLVNLIVNAIHAMPQGGRLGLSTVDADRDGVEGVTIDVSDTGAGMTPEVMARIFDSFFTTKSREGTGLGLSISQMLIAQQGGKITVRSAPNEGTTFTIWLPATEDVF
jgi:signal transduction histidine kinase